MSRRQAEYAMKQMLMSGYGHYSRMEEHKLITAVLQGKMSLPGASVKREMQFINETMNEFPLAAQPLRSIKNGMICTVAIICRYAADLGADDERSYALSDYYINEIEKHVDMNNCLELLTEIYQHYIELIRTGREETLTLPIRRALRYIQQHIYEPCRLKDVANAVKLHPGYLSFLFKSETGKSLTRYIRDKKIDEAKNLLCDLDYAVSDIAEMLGYNSSSYFIKVFRSVNGCSPREYTRISGIHKDY